MGIARYAQHPAVIGVPGGQRTGHAMQDGLALLVQQRRLGGVRERGSDVLLPAGTVIVRLTSQSGREIRRSRFRTTAEAAPVVRRVKGPGTLVMP